MSDPTDAEMLEWLDGLADATKAAALECDKDERNDNAAVMALGYRMQSRMFRAVAARLRQSTGKSEPAPTFDEAGIFGGRWFTDR